MTRLTGEHSRGGVVIDLTRAHPCQHGPDELPERTLRREDILVAYEVFVAEHGLDPATTVLMSGAALVLHGLRERAHDIDLQVPAAVIEQLLAKGHNGRYSTPRGLLGGTWIRVIEPFAEFDVTTAGYEYEVINGIPVMTLSALLELKLAFQRPKDMDDIRNILDEMLKRPPKVFPPMAYPFEA